LFLPVHVSSVSHRPLKRIRERSRCIRQESTPLLDFASVVRLFGMLPVLEGWYMSNRLDILRDTESRSSLHLKGTICGKRVWKIAHSGRLTQGCWKGKTADLLMTPRYGPRHAALSHVPDRRRLLHPGPISNKKPSIRGLHPPRLDPNPSGHDPP
jgi:hypothetical protein